MSLETYYTAIRDGLPDKPFEAPLVRLRQWIAEKLHEKSPIFDRPVVCPHGVCCTEGGCA